MPLITQFSISKQEYTDGIETLGFSAFHRNDLDLGGLLADTEGLFTDISIGAEKLEYIRVDRLIAGSIQADQYIAGGQTSYDTGTGFWIGLSGSTAKFSLGNSAGNKVTWDGSTLAISGSLTASTIDIGGSDATSFHVDIDGNMWLGAATFALSPAKISNAGAATFSSATITGNITANTGYLGGTSGWVVSTNYIKDVAGAVGLSSVVTAGDDIRIWAGHATPASAPFYVTESGAVVASSITATGTINTTAGYVGGVTALVVEASGFNFGAAGVIRGGATAYDTGTGWWLGYDTTAYKFFIGAAAGNKLTWDGSTLTIAGSTVTGSLAVSTSGNIRSGQTAYNTGVGWFMEYNAGTPRSSIGDPSGNFMTWDGSVLSIKGVITATTATIASTTTDTFTINSDLTDANVDLVFGRTTGGNATLRYNGTTVNIDKSFTVSGTAVVLTSRILTAGAGLTGGGDLSSDRTFTVGAGDGITINADDVALTTPGTLTVSSTNSSSGSHTHAITSSSNPGAAASLLASDASGFLTLVKISADTLADKSGGNLTISPAGDIIFDPTGNDLLPNTGYDLNIGSLSKKYLTLHAAELWVETLVAQNTIATIGGRILVGPTTTLTRDLTDAATTIYVKHNEMASGDRAYMEANGKVEFFAITSAPTLEAEGDYSYTVTRNLDGTGANVWNAGDAMFNSGTIGDGFIDLYSINGVKGASEAGPSIVGNVRNSATYNDWTSHWAIGNLNGLYGYGVTTYGVAFGEYAASKTHLTLDSTNGLRFFNGTATVIGQWDVSGNITVGNAASENVYITSSSVQIRDATTVYTDLTAGVLTLGVSTTEHLVVSSTSVQILDNTTVYTDLTAGALTLGDSANEHALINTSGIALKDGASIYAQFAATTTIGLTASEHISISSASFQIKDGATVYTDLTAGALLLGLTGAGQSNVYINSGTIQLRTNTTANISLDASGNITVGEVGASKSNVYITAGAISLRTNTTDKITLGTDGNISLLGNLSVGTAGALYSGQSAYDTGTGYWMEYNAGTPRMSIGISTGNKMTFDGTNLEVTGGLKPQIAFTANRALLQGDTVSVFSADNVRRCGFTELTSNATIVNDTAGNNFDSNCAFRGVEMSSTCKAVFYRANTGNAYQIAQYVITPTAITLISDNNLTGNTYLGFDVAKVNSTSVIITYVVAGALKARVISNIPFDGPTEGAEQSIVASNVSEPQVIYISDSHVLFFYRNTADEKIYLQMCTRSGDTITADTNTAVWTNTDAKVLQSVRRNGTTNYIAILVENTADSEAQVICGLYDTGTKNFSSIGSEATFSGEDISIVFNSVEITSLDDTTFGVAYGVSGSTTVKARVINRSGTALTVNTAVTLATARAGIDYSVGNFKLNERNLGASYSSALAVGSFSVLELSADKTTFTEVTSTVAKTGNSSGESLLFRFNSTQLLFAFANYDVGSNQSAGSILTMTNNYGTYVGVANANISTAASGIINTGGNTTVISSLTAATKYYLEFGGLVTTDSNGSPVRAGVAKDTNEFIVQP